MSEEAVDKGMQAHGTSCRHWPYTLEPHAGHSHKLMVAWVTVVLDTQHLTDSAACIKNKTEYRHLRKNPINAYTILNNLSL